MPLSKALIIPGFGGTEDGYQYVEASFRAISVSPEFVPITWSRTVLTQNLGQFQGVYVRCHPETTIIFGYSLGAMIALLTAAEHNPAVLILASIAPWFAEDIPRRSEYHKQVAGHRRLAVYENTSFDEIAARIKAKTFILTSEGEGKRWPAYLERAKDAHRKIANSMLTEVPRAGHDINHLAYKKKVEELIVKLHTA
jgi:predicted alpha/beta-fold hydrolase